MNAESAREFLLGLPDVVETQQFGGLVYWIGDKAVGGKMFCWLMLDGNDSRVASFPAGPEHFAELVEREGLFPAPYVARIHWVAAARWGALRDSEWREEFIAAAERVRAKLPPKMQRFLALPKTEQRKAVVAARAKLKKK